MSSGYQGSVGKRRLERRSDMFISHQANLRISQFVQRRLGLSDDQVRNSIRQNTETLQRLFYSHCFSEAVEAGAGKEGDLVCLAAFGSGFTWGASLIRW